MYFIVLLQYNIKKIRNNIEKTAPSGTAKCLTKDGKFILWSHWKEVYLWDQKYNSAHCHERLQDDHFELTASSRMRNGLAEDVLDKKMFLLMRVFKCSYVIFYLTIIRRIHLFDNYVTSTFWAQEPRFHHSYFTKID